MGEAQAQAAIRSASTALSNSYSKKTPDGESSLGKDDFLKLMMAQATNQDPMNPMDSQGMMNQLTSMGSLEQLVNMNKQMESLNTVQNDISRSNVFSFLDKDVKVRGGSVKVSEGAAPGMSYSIPREAEMIKVNVSDQQGNSVRTITLGPQGPGSHQVNWDTADEDGQSVPNGTYRYSVVAKTAEDESLPVSMIMQGKVAGVTFKNGRPLLQVNGEQVDINEIIEMSARSSALFGNRPPMPLRQSIEPKPPVTNSR